MLLLATSALAAPRLRIQAPVNAGELRIVFATPGERAQRNGAAVDVGTIRNSGGRKGRALVVKPFAVRVERIGTLQGGTASLHASLVTNDPRLIVRLDGQPLDTIPRVVDAHVPIGVTRTHRLTVEVPPAVPAGDVAASIVWDAVAD